ncbi:MAG TPA: F0F1 ATP synthase subunit gamma [Actinomycetes bacterium]
MPAQLRVIRRRIRSVQSTKKITNAQELIAASRLVRAQQRVEQSRPYTNQLTTALSEIATTEGGLEHPLLERRAEVNAAAVVVLTSDRGFAGPHNANILRTAEELLARLRGDGIEPRMYVAGRKGVSYYRFRRRELTDSWTGVSDAPRYDDAREIADTVLNAFLEREVDEIFMIYADFVSAMVQRPRAVRVIPLVVEEGEERPPQPLPMYVFEPDVESVLSALLPRYVAARIFTAMLESAASEWSARRRAMSAATDNAEQLTEALTREYNQARQAAITQEIMEIVGGAEALQSGS